METQEKTLQTECLKLSVPYDHVCSIQYNQEGDKIICTSLDGIYIEDCNTGERVQFANASAFYAEFDADGSKAYSLGREGFQIWDAQSGQCLNTFSGNPLFKDSPVAFSKNGKRVATEVGNVTHIWNVYSPHSIKSSRMLISQQGGIYTACFSPDGNWLATSAFTNNNIWLWNIHTQELKVEMRGHSSKVETIRFSSDGKKIVTTSYDSTIRIWNTENGECELVLDYYCEDSDAVFIHEDTQILFVSRGNAFVCDAKTGIVLQKFDASQVEFATFSPLNDTVALATGEPSILLYRFIP